MTVLGHCRECGRQMSAYDKKYSRVLCGLCVAASDRVKNPPAAKPSGFDLACLEIQATGDYVVEL